VSDDSAPGPVAGKESGGGELVAERVDRPSDHQHGGLKTLPHVLVTLCRAMRPPELKRPAQSDWPPGSPARLCIVWMLHWLLVAFGLLVMFIFLLRTAPEEMAVQGRSPDEYFWGLLWLYVRAVAQTIFVQEPVKVLAITFVSPQMLPSVQALRATSCREAVRLCLRGAFAFVYALMMFL
jgi:hypothetical protein